MVRGTVHLSRKRAVRTGHRRWHVRKHPHRRRSAGRFRRSRAAAGPGPLRVRRADAPVAPGDGRSIRQVRGFLHLDPDTVRGWPPGFRRTGLAPVDPAAYPEREGKLTRAREASPASPPRGANGVRDIIPPGFGQEHTRGGAIGPTRRPGSGHVRPEPLPGQADRAAREALMRKCGRPRCGSGRDAASGRASRRPTPRTRPHRAPVGGHAPPREA